MKHLSWLFSVSLGLFIFSGSQVSAAFSDWSFLRPVSEKNEMIGSEDFLKMLEFSSENPTHQSLSGQKNTVVPRYTNYRFWKSKAVKQQEEKESLDLSVMEREGLSDLDRAKLRQNRARLKALRLR